MNHTRRDARYSTLVALLASGMMSAPLPSCGDVHSDVIALRNTGDAGGCSADGQCGGSTPRCDVMAGRCVACLRSQDCADDQTCSLPAGTCVPSCVVSGGCTGENPVCDATGVCRSCETNDECPSAAPRCSSGACVECLAASDCRDSDEPFCSPMVRCSECTNDSHCDDDGERCSLALGECATPCSSTDSCDADAPICDLDLGFCVECQSDRDCDTDERCIDAECEDLDDDD